MFKHVLQKGTSKHELSRCHTSVVVSPARNDAPTHRRGGGGLDNLTRHTLAHCPTVTYWHSLSASLSPSWRGHIDEAHVDKTGADRTLASSQPLRRTLELDPNTGQVTGRTSRFWHAQFTNKNKQKLAPRSRVLYLAPALAGQQTGYLISIQRCSNDRWSLIHGVQRGCHMRYTTGDACAQPPSPPPPNPRTPSSQPQKKKNALPVRLCRRGLLRQRPLCRLL